MTEFYASQYDGTRSEIGLSDDSESSRKAQILNVIKQFPGIRYRELLRKTQLSNGVLSHHLKGLEDSKAIRIGRGSRSTRYFPFDVSEKEYNMLPFIRHERIRQILLLLLEQDQSSFNEIVEHTHSFPSTISLHLKRLRDAEIVRVRYGERHQLYEITNKEEVAEILTKYKSSYLDKAVSNYVDFVDDL